MIELIKNYENQLRSVETRIEELASKSDNALGTKERDTIQARIALLEKEHTELIHDIHEMKTR